MYNENLISDIQNGKDVKHNMELLYTANLGLIGTLANSMNVHDYDTRNDFFQLAYLALDKAVHIYDCNGAFSFLSYFRRCLLHEYYAYRLEMQFPMRLTRQAYNDLQNDDSQFEYSDIKDFEYVEDAFDYVEDKMLRDVLWSEVAENLSDLNYYVVYERYVHKKTLHEISKEVGIGNERVRLREKRSLLRLRNNNNIRIIAEDYFNL